MNLMTSPTTRPICRQVPLIFYETSETASESTTVDLQTLQSVPPGRIVHAMSSNTQQFLTKKRSRLEAETAGSIDKVDAQDSTDQHPGPTEPPRKKRKQSDPH